MEEKLSPEQRQTPESALPSQAEIEAADEALDILVLTQGTLADDAPFWAYVAIPPSRYLAFQEAERHGNYDLSEFGRILEYGKGEQQPPESVRKYMEESYGANHNFEQNVQNTVRDVQKDISLKKRIFEKFGIASKD